MQPVEHDRIQCLECGKWFKALPRHIERTHIMTCDEYRVKHKLAASVALVCEAWSERASQVAKTNVRVAAARKPFEGVGPKPGYVRSQASKLTRAKVEHEWHLKGTEAAAKVDKTEDRRKAIEPYPVTVDQAAERLGCTVKAAYNFLSYCVLNGKLKRIKRGLYGPS